MVESNIWDVQASTPYEQTVEGVTTKHYRPYVNLRLHVLAESAERVLELMHEHHPEARVHQIIKRNSVSDVILDPRIFGDRSEGNL